MFIFIFKQKFVCVCVCVCMHVLVHSRILTKNFRFIVLDDLIRNSKISLNPIAVATDKTTATANATNNNNNIKTTHFPY